MSWSRNAWAVDTARLSKAGSSRSLSPSVRGLHSSTFQLNLSLF